ncbi:MAG: DUF2723 domain-containing protein [Bacteroidales bacterium]|nr:DUF2723 domain-containing protein [Bacteroidales bacterium]
MTDRKFNLWNRICALAAFVVSAFTYISTIEPTASFWDCGEFIASSYKLEVGHPPGNPVFQLFARLFAMFSDASHAAVAVNTCSAVCSALTIFFLYLTIVFLVKRVVKRSEDGTFTLPRAVAIYGSGLVGALAYTFTDTFWFSAVEGEVYAMSSLFTALVFWAMTKWYDEADQPRSNRWIVLISFLMGLSIGVHLLNLLTIPSLVFLFYFKKRESEDYSFWEYVKIFLVSIVILSVILFVIVPLLPKFAAYVDLFFVNVLHLPYNTGATIFMLALLGASFYGIYRTYLAGKAFWNTVLLCFTTIVIGFSIFSICIIRSAVKTPTNEYQPDNPFTLVRYLAREQYGSKPLLYGEYFDAPYTLETKKYWAAVPEKVDGKVKDRYMKTDAPPKVIYKSSGKMLFPRMWSNADPKYADFYSYYTDGKGRNVPGAEYKKPTMGANIGYFLAYQMHWMYWRYFMWNFAGRQNDVHSPTPGSMFTGNWECGIPFLDKLRLGDQSEAPDYLLHNPGKNHYYLLPLLLGIIGIFFQFSRDRRGSWITFLLFFMTGIAIVIYLNQPPFQVRERDYAYAGSFYAFSIWIGFAVIALYSFIEDMLSLKGTGENGVLKTSVASSVTLVCLGVPALMAAENWDDHDRSNRYTAVEIATNYLNSVGPNGIVITHGDNDTFPLWYAQEVEGVRTDVRVVNTSLLGTDWHIDQMKYAVNDSAPLDLTVDYKQYLYGTNDYVYIYDQRNTVIPIADVMTIFKHPKAKLPLKSGISVDYIMSRKISVPVNKENCLKYGIVPEKYADRIPDEIILNMSKDKEYLTKGELFMLDLLSNYNWDRPISLLSMGGDLNMGIKEYFLYDGFTYRFVPIKNKMSSSKVGLSDPEDLYDKMMNVYKFDALKRTDYYVDYQNMYTFQGVISHRLMFVNAAKEMIKDGRNDRAVELLERCEESVPDCNYPLVVTEYGFSNEIAVYEMISTYFAAGAPEKALDLAERFACELYVSANFYAGFYDYAKEDFEDNCQMVFYVADLLRSNGFNEEGDTIENGLSAMLKDYISEEEPVLEEEDAA